VGYNPVMRILIVDDDDAFAEIASTLLGTAGDIEVAGRARNGREAIDRAAELEPDVILMDIDMPIMDGVEATRRIMEGGFRGRVVVVSGSDVTAHITGVRRAGAVAYLRKSRIAEDLLTVLDALRPPPGTGPRAPA